MFIDRFFNFLQYEKRYSPHTLLSYKNDINQYVNFLSQEIEISFLEATHQHIRSWMVSLLDTGIEPRTIARKISALRSFYKFLIKEEALVANPVLKVQVPKIAKRLPGFIEQEKIITLLDHHMVADDFSSLRDQLIIEMLFGTGIRLSELIGIKIKDISIESKTVKVLGKRNKERIIPITTTLLNLIVKYLDQRKINYNNSDHLIVTNKGLGVYPKFIYRKVNQYLSLVTAQEKRSPHVLRHSFATSLLNQGADINAIKELLGHSSLAATQVYTHNSIERIKLIYKQAHPKA